MADVLIAIAQSLLLKAGFTYRSAKGSPTRGVHFTTY